jgi:WD40 repeat protein
MIRFLRTHNKIVIAVSLAVVSVCVWMFLPAPRNRPIDRRISNVALSPTGAWVAAGTAQGPVRISNGRPGTAGGFIPLRRGPLNDLQFSPDERLLAVAGKDLVLYPLKQPAAPRRLRSDGRNYGTVRFSRDGETVLVVTGAGTIELLDARSGATRLTICCSTVYGEVAFTPDERSIVNAGHWPGLWDSRSGQLIARLTKDRQFHAFGPIAFVGQVSDLLAILMGSQDGRVYCWDLTTRQLIAMSPPHAEYVNTIAISSTGLVAYAGFGGPVRLWNPRSGEERSLAAAHPTSNLALKPNGASIMFGTADGELLTIPFPPTR